MTIMNQILRTEITRICRLYGGRITKDNRRVIRSVFGKEENKRAARLSLRRMSDNLLNVTNVSTRVFFVSFPG